MISRSGLLHTLRFAHLRLPLATVLSSGTRYAWTSSNGEGHSLDRSRRSDTTDPTTKRTAGGLKGKGEATKRKDNSKSNATEERNHEGSMKKAENEFPEAPWHIIGMSDERGKKGI
ncbi:hypothetical protein I7I50_09933 [Histoplasma capsulatum G186AR]|uniref:Uncharacterized protein n=1 Tax=Ajellomyces capsulatus TaxID=5037 RepID=A0A8H7Z324_AJECA|nr:hypothetical protein I7I52_01171 [Histoplasma capsulatum]QSS68832.1 hypothetical protein I7I50_09933 [Histoplasma capsulatum G186AR]